MTQKYYRGHSGTDTCVPPQAISHPALTLPTVLMDASKTLGWKQNVVPSRLCLVGSIITRAAALGRLTSGQGASAELHLQLKKVKTYQNGSTQHGKRLPLAEWGVSVQCLMWGSALWMLKDWGQGWYLDSSSPKGVSCLQSCLGNKNTLLCFLPKTWTLPEVSNKIPSLLSKRPVIELSPITAVEVVTH